MPNSRLAVLKTRTFFDITNFLPRPARPAPRVEVLVERPYPVVHGRAITIGQLDAYRFELSALDVFGVREVAQYRCGSRHVSSFVTVTS